MIFGLWGCLVSYIFRLNDTESYENWFRSEPGRTVFEFQKSLLLKVWSPVSPQRVLEVGCGSGMFLEWLVSRGHMVAGIDPSLPSLELARRRLGSRVRLDRGFAEHLPYEDNEFDTVAIITSLEFVDDPMQTLREAFRVARHNVLIGVLNRYSIGRVHSFLEKFWKESFYTHARFFSVFQLRKMASRILCGKFPLEWRTCFVLPFAMLKYFHFLERSSFLQRHPFGHFIAMRIDMRSLFRTIQTPIFTEIPTGVANASVRSLCWRASETREESSKVSMQKVSSGMV